MKTTRYHINYWKNRQIDWEQAYFNPAHPHRLALMQILSKFQFGSILELGCGAGANMFLVQNAFRGVDVGGVDVNKEAIDMASKKVVRGHFSVEPAHKVFLSDQCVDIVLTDMCLIYYSPLMITKAVNEMKRLAKKAVILCEFHHPDFWTRWQFKRRTGYNAYNWPKLLASKGFYDIQLQKMSEEDWPGGEPQKSFGYFITARL